MTNSVYLRLESILINVIAYKTHQLLIEFVEQNKVNVVQGEVVADLVINAEPDGLHLQWNCESEKALLFYIDVEKTVNQLRSYPAPKQGAFNQALGKKTRSVIDATGGWGGDAILMCTQGYCVSIIERQPVMALLLSDAMYRLSKTAWAQDNDVQVPQVIHANACDYFTFNYGADNSTDCVYLDPMFPPKKKKSAAVNKQMQLLQWLVGEDKDASVLVERVLSAGVSRIAVKRPDYAEPLYRRPSNQFSSKLVHYDVYLTS